MSRDVVEMQSPTGTGGWIVKGGDCMESIALRTGHFWKTLWNRPENAQLKRARKDPNVLLPGDRVTVPPVDPKDVHKPTDAKHRFRRRGVPSRLKMVVRDLEEPVRNAPFELVVDGRNFNGTTDGNGRLEIPIPPDAVEGRLTVGEEDPLTFDLDLGSLDPLESVSGIQARLENLGFAPGPVDGVLGPKTQAALAAFATSRELEPPPKGKVTRDVLDALRDAHGF